MAGYKSWGTEMLASADVQGYLMNQAVIICTSGTRPSSPPTGMHIWETDTSRARVWTGSTWELQPPYRLFAVKTADETVNNSTTLQDDDHLSLSLPSPGFYAVESFLIYTATTTADLSYALKLASSTISAPYSVPISQTNFDSVQVSVFDDVRALAGFGSDVCWHAYWYTVDASSFSSVKLQFAQKSAEASACTVRAGSYLLATPLSA